jgi:hypothetical protein
MLIIALEEGSLQALRGACKKQGVRTASPLVVGFRRSNGQPVARNRAKFRGTPGTCT